MIETHDSVIEVIGKTTDLVAAGRFFHATTCIYYFADESSRF
jgi:hypothetical protein